MITRIEKSNFRRFRVTSQRVKEVNFTRGVEERDPTPRQDCPGWRRDDSGGTREREGRKVEGTSTRRINIEGVEDRVSDSQILYKHLTLS